MQWSNPKSSIVTIVTAAARMPPSLGLLFVAMACGRSAPPPSSAGSAEAGADAVTRCAAQAVAPGPRRFRLDWNGDGIDDLALSAAGSVAIWLGGHAGLGDGPVLRLTAPADTTGFGEALVPIGDLDGDGFGDLVVAAPSTVTSRERGGEFRGGAGYLYRGGSSAATPERLTVLGTAPRFGASLAAGDLDGDGRLELIAATPSNSLATIQGLRPRWRAGVYVYGSDLAPHALWPANPDSRDVIDVIAGGDLDGDGCDDVIVRTLPAQQRDAANYARFAGADTDVVELRVYTGGSDGIAADRGHVLARSNKSGPPSPLVVPNFDGDGRAAVAVAKDHGVSLARLGLTGAPAWTAELLFPVARATIDYLATGDLDGDGRSDVIAGSHTAGVIVAYRGGAPAVAPVTLSMPPAAQVFPLSLSVGDFDGDGRDDLAASSSASGDHSPDQLWIYRGDATTLLGAPVARRMVP
ncbi:MAG: FG-GAP repeat protein [Myxococcales bacterium]|nr:FG-GAP repeat protein [Myxococcales bacterium]